MFVVTKDNKVINFDRCMRAEIHRTGSSMLPCWELRLVATEDNYVAYNGDRKEVETAFATFCEALAKGASMISYSEEYMNEGMG